MYEPHLDFQFDYKALPAVWRITSVVLSAVIAGLIVFEAFAAAGGGVA
jgi:hypothetical protein